MSWNLIYLAIGLACFVYQMSLWVTEKKARIVDTVARSLEERASPQQTISQITTKLDHSLDGVQLSILVLIGLAINLFAWPFVVIFLWRIQRERRSIVTVIDLDDSQPAGDPTSKAARVGDSAPRSAPEEGPRGNR